MRRTSGLAAGIVIGLTMAGLAVVAVVVTGGLRLKGPFSTDTKHRDQSALLVELRDVSRYEAADGQFQVLVDLEHDTRYLPSWLAGDRTTFVAEGEVGAVVDFSTLGAGAVSTSEDGKTATVTLPEPTLGEPRIDPDKSRVMSQDKGILNRFNEAMSGEGTHDQELYQAAEAKLARAASQSDLQNRAEANTTTMLTDLLQGLGYERVDVEFDEPGSAA
jgi:hypothetical protein